jgi:hypothetical protein
LLKIWTTQISMGSFEKFDFRRNGFQGQGGWSKVEFHLVGNVATIAAQPFADKHRSAHSCQLSRDKARHVSGCYSGAGVGKRTCDRYRGIVARMTAGSTVTAIYYLLVLPIGIGFLSHAYRHFFQAPPAPQDRVTQ